MIQKRRSLVCATLILQLGLSLTARAQSNEEIFEQFQFNFSTPGARAAAMGGAFIGLADDATAAVSNPAGLVILTRPQVYFEFKRHDLRVRRPAAVDSFFTGQTSTFGESTNSISFLNLAWPVSQNLTVSFTRHEFLDYQESFQLDPRPIPGTTDNLSFTSGGNILAFFERVGTFDSVQANANFEGVSYAGSLAYKVPGIGNLSSTGLSVGLTVSVDRLSAQASTVRFVREEPVFFDSDSGAYLKQGCTSLLGAGCISFDVSASQIVRNQSTIDDDDVALGFTVGSLWRQSENLALGAVYTRSPKFKVQEAFGFNPGATTPVSTLFGGSLPPQLCCFPPFIPNSFTNEPIQTFAGFPRDVPFDVPDRLGAGVKFRPLDRLQFVFDLLRVYHSDLAQDLTIINEFQAESLTSDDFAIDDATEIHFGGEIMVMQQPIAGFLRAGVFTNPEHSLRFVGEINETASSDLSNLNRTVQFRTLFNFVGRQTGPGITAGGGIAVPEVGGSDVGLQIDFAYVTIDSFDELVASFAVRF